MRKRIFNRINLCPSGPIRTAVCQSVTSPQPAECENFDVRLVNGSSKMEGRLELCANGYWSNVCNDYRARSLGLDAYSLWTKYAARLVCRKLGFPTEGTVVINHHINVKLHTPPLHVTLFNLYYLYNSAFIIIELKCQPCLGCLGSSRQSHPPNVRILNNKINYCSFA